MNKKEYYTAPSDEVFEDIKQAAMKLWVLVDTDHDAYGYATDKINRIKDIKNVSDNAWYMVAMFDDHNQVKLHDMLGVEAQAKIEELWEGERAELDYILKDE